MTDLTLHFTEAELLSDDDVIEPLVARGVRCHGGYDEHGRYRPPRSRFRVPAIAAWQASHREQFGTEILDAPVEQWPGPYPNVAQAKALLRAGVRDPVVTILTRIGTVEGFGGLIRHVHAGDLQRFVVESIDGTCVSHLDRGLFEAQARDEAGWEAEAGHSHMWFCARDIAFEDPPSEDETQEMLARMGIVPPPASGAGAPRGSQARLVDDLDPQLEWMLRRMTALLFIEVSAFHMFAWAEDILGDEELVAGEGEAAELVRCIREDERPHVDYLRTALTELRDRTFVGESGRHLPGSQVIDRIWRTHLAESLGPRRDDQVASTRAEVEFALAGHRRRSSILEEFDALGSLRPGPDGRLVDVEPGP